MTARQPTRSTRLQPTPLGAGGVSLLQWAVLLVACFALVVTVPIAVGVGHALVPVFAVLCALEMLLCVGVLFQAQTAARRRGHG